MAVKGAIHMNEPAKDYQFRLLQDQVVEPTVINQWVSHLQITWGNAFLAYPDPAAHGIRLTIEQGYDPAGVTYVHTVTLETPLATPYVYTGAGLLSPTDTTEIQIDDVALAVASDCTYTFDSGELRLLVAGGVVHTISAPIAVSSGIGFDLRNDTVYADGRTLISIPEAIPCAEHFVDQPTYDLFSACITTAGYQVAGVSDKLMIDVMGPDTSDCDCFEELPCIKDVVDSGCIALIEEVDSWRVMIKSDAEGAVTKELIASGSCDCPPPYFGTETYELWSVVTRSKSRESSVSLYPKTSGLKNTERYRKTICLTDTEETTTDTLEATTYCSMSRQTDVTETTRYCRAISPLCFTNVEDPPPPAPCGPDLPDDTSCNYFRLVLLNHPDTPSCTDETFSAPYVMQDPFGRYHRASIKDGDVQYNRSDSCMPVPSWALEVMVTSDGDCERPRMAMDVNTQRIELVYFRTGPVASYMVFSDDDGATWSSPASFP